MDFHSKYLKYKNKYLHLKQTQIGKGFNKDVIGDDIDEFIENVMLCPMCKNMDRPLNRENACELECGHIYHRICIQKWLAISEKKICLICRSNKVTILPNIRSRTETMASLTPKLQVIQPVAAFAAMARLPTVTNPVDWYQSRFYVRYRESGWLPAKPHQTEALKQFIATGKSIIQMNYYEPLDDEIDYVHESKTTPDSEIVQVEFKKITESLYTYKTKSGIIVEMTTRLPLAYIKFPGQPWSLTLNHQRVALMNFIEKSKNHEIDPTKVYQISVPHTVRGMFEAQFFQTQPNLYKYVQSNGTTIEMKFQDPTEIVEDLSDADFHNAVCGGKRCRAHVSVLSSGNDDYFMDAARYERMGDGDFPWINLPILREVPPRYRTVIKLLSQ